MNDMNRSMSYRDEALQIDRSDNGAVKMSENRCIVCGEIIPEGRQVCPNCENSEGATNSGQTLKK